MKYFLKSQIASTVSSLIMMVVQAFAVQDGTQVRPQLVCNQPGKVRDALIAEAERAGYTSRRLEFKGNPNTSDVTLRRRIPINEGDRFTRVALITSIANLSKVRQLEKVKLDNVVITLDQKDRVVDWVVCVTEKNKYRRQ